jgi:VWFA-related protein
MKLTAPIRRSICVLSLCCPFLAAAQTAAPPAELPVAKPVQVDRHIALDVVVNDKSGNPISGLQQEDFTLLNNKAPQNLVSFRAIDAKATDAPTEVILLVDAVNTNFTSVSYERQEIEHFLQQNGGKLAAPTSIIFFEDTKTEMQRSPSQDGNALLAGFDRNMTGLRDITRAAGFYGAEERLQLSLKTLGELAAYEIHRPGRKLIVWISPGWPMLTGPRVEMSGSQQRHIFESIVGMSTVLRQANITLYSVDPQGTNDAGTLRSFYYEEFLKGVTAPNKSQVANLALQVLATQSGGRVFTASNDIAGEISRCVMDAGPHYELSFESAPAERPNEYHSLQVKIDKPGLSVRTRTGYYAQP